MPLNRPLRPPLFAADLSLPTLVEARFWARSHREIWPDFGLITTPTTHSHLRCRSRIGDGVGATSLSRLLAARPRRAPARSGSAPGAGDHERHLLGPRRSRGAGLTGYGPVLHPDIAENPHF